MHYRKFLVSALALAGLGLGSGVANAVPIVGSIVMTGFFDCDCFASGDTSIVSQLLSIEALEPALAGAGAGDYAGSGGAVTPIGDIKLDGSGLPAAIYTFADGTVFTATAVQNILRSGLDCGAAACSDSLEFSLSGTVSRAGFDNTPGVLLWIGQGSCLGAAGTCTTEPSASWSARLSSPMDVVDVAEPSSLALLGLGLLGIAARRRMAT
jgi:hypothetical protein